MCLAKTPAAIWTYACGPPLCLSLVQSMSLSSQVQVCCLSTRVADCTELFSALLTISNQNFITLYDFCAIWMSVWSVSQSYLHIIESGTCIHLLCMSFTSGMCCINCQSSRRAVIAWSEKGSAMHISHLALYPEDGSYLVFPLMTLGQYLAAPLNPCTNLHILLRYLRYFYCYVLP